MYARAGKAAWLFVGLAATIAVNVGCGKPFDVKTRVDLPSAGPLAKGEARDVEVEAAIITNENVLYDTFDANLILAGVLPIKIRFTNRGSETVNLKRARFELRVHDRGKYKRLSARNAYKRLVSYYGISAYNIAGYKDSRSDFESYHLDVNIPLAAGDSREGLIYFRASSETPVPSELVLVVTRLVSSSEPLEIKLRN